MKMSSLFHDSVRTDDTIAFLMSMGFDLEDCQDAINFGKSTVESAVEWIVAGKPGLRPSAASTSAEGAGPSLKLRPSISEFGRENTAVSFQKPHPITEVSTQPQSGSSQSENTLESQSAESMLESDQSEVQIVSRMHLNDSQRKYKENFQQKKYEEAKKQAVLEKRRQKEAHARVLKEIAEDREKKKLLQHAPDHSEAKKASTDTEAEKPKEQKSETIVPADTSENCLLQIRLPDGRSLRQSFSVSATLQQVWDFTTGHHTDMYGYTFIQPFPRHEYTTEQMQCTLAELKLTPTGSLVLQKKQTTSPSSNSSEGAEPMETQSLPAQSPHPPPVPSCVHDPPSHHRWGQGNPLEGENQGVLGYHGQGNPLEGENQEGPLDEGMDEIEQEGDPQVIIPGVMGQGHHGGALGQGHHAGALGQGHYGGALGIWHPGMGMPGGLGGQQMPPPMGNIMGQANDIFGMQVGGQAPGQAFGGVGQRLVSEGEPGHNDAQQHRPARELVLESVQARMARPAAASQPSGVGPVASASQSAGTSMLPTYQPVLSLVTHCLKHIMHRLNDPRNQLLSLSGVSENMAQVIIEFLIKEKQLKPKTLNAFIPCYLRKLVLDCYPYATNELLHSVRLHTNLSHLSVSACPLITDAGLQCLTSLKKLKKLNLSCCKQVSNKCVTFLKSLQNLVSLNMEDTGITDSGVIDFLSARPEHLQHLNLSRTAVSHAIIPHIHNCVRQLKSLTLEDTKIMSLSGIQQFTSLEVLNVARTGIVTESLFCLANHSGLRSLNIANTDNVNGDEALRHLSGLELHTLILPSRHTTTNLGIQYISGLPLTSLDLTNYNQVGDDAMEHIGKMISLRQLILTNTKLTDTGMLFLEGLKHLEVLNVDRTMITDEGAQIISGLTNLVELSMSSTRVTSKFLLSGACNNCCNMAKLNLSKTAVSKKGVLCLELPFLQMLNLDGTKVTPDLTVSMVTGCPKLTQMSMRNLEPFTRDDEIEEADMEM